MPSLIRSAVHADLTAIRAIYNHYVLNSTCTFQLEPESEEERLAWFDGRSPLHPVIVCELEAAIRGWASLSPWKSPGAYAHAVEASVYVHHDFHRQGVGRALLAELINRGRAAGHHTIIGGACTEHPASLALQANLGFQEVGCFREVGSKFGRLLDVIYMQYIL